MLLQLQQTLNCENIGKLVVENENNVLMVCVQCYKINKNVTEDCMKMLYQGENPEQMEMITVYKSKISQIF